MTTENKLVTVICVCYNHEHYVRDAIQSVLNQSYKKIELIVVDDGSTDKSVDVIKSMNVRLIDLKTNRGYTSAFNEAWRVCKGDFIIDLAADDELPVDRIKIGVEEFLKYDESYGVQFGDTRFSDGTLHSEKFPNPPQGDVYIELIRRYFISSASQMIRRSVLTMLNGFDETLAYEDFDFWIRSSRQFKYFYTPQILMHKRIVKGSMSDKQFRKGSPQQISTYRVCEKIKALNVTKKENDALRKRIWYEIKQAVLRRDFGLVPMYFKLL